VPDARSRTNTSGCRLVSPGTRFVASDVNATVAASALITVPRTAPSPWMPALEMLTRLVSAPGMARTKASRWPLPSPQIRSLAVDVNATWVPSPLRTGCSLAPLPIAPGRGTLTRSVAPRVRSRR
jgi:hypothetical protein